MSSFHTVVILFRATVTLNCAGTVCGVVLTNQQSLLIANCCCCMSASASASAGTHSGTRTRTHTAMINYINAP